MVLGQEDSLGAWTPHRDGGHAPNHVQFQHYACGPYMERIDFAGPPSPPPIERGGVLGREARRVMSGQKDGEEPLGYPAASKAPGSQEGIEKREGLSCLSDESSER